MMVESAREPSGRDATLAAIIMVTSAVGVGFLPSLAKFALEDGADSITFGTLRALVSGILVGGWMLVTGGSFRIPLPLVLAAAVASLTNAISTYTFLEAIRYLDISLLSLIVFTYPLQVALYYHWVGHTRLSLLRLMWAAIAFLGLGLALAVRFDQVSQYGLLLAAGSSLLTTVMVVAMVKVNDKVGGNATFVHLQFWNVVLFALVLLVKGEVHPPQSYVGWIGVLGNGVIMAAAFLAFFVAVRLIGASRATMYGILEPIAAILLAMLLFHEWLSLVQWLGVTLVAAGMFFMEAKFRRPQAVVTQR